MTEIVVENVKCPTCETELPAKAVFCYHCGNSIKPNDKGLSDAWLRGDITDTEKNDGVSTNEDFVKEKELKSAASLRVKAKRLPPKEIEVRWEEREDAPNLRFLGGAVVLIILTFLIYLLAMYLR